MASCSNQKQSFLYLWNEFYESISEKIIKKFDITVALVHCLLVRDINFRCIGNGEDKLLVEGEIESENLPDGWNEDLYRYALRYVYDNRLYILFGHKMNDCIVLNILNVSTKKVSNILLNPEDLVDTDEIPSILKRIRQELVEPIIIHPKVNATTQTDPVPNVRRLVNFNRGLAPSVRHVHDLIMNGTHRDIDQLRGTRGPLSLYRFNSLSASNRFHPQIIQEHARRLQALRNRMAATYDDLPLSQLNNVNNNPNVGGSNINPFNRTSSEVSDLAGASGLSNFHNRNAVQNSAEENNANEDSISYHISRLEGLSRMLSSPNIRNTILHSGDIASNIISPSSNSNTASASINRTVNNPLVNSAENSASNFLRTASEPRIPVGNEDNDID